MSSPIQGLYTINDLLHLGTQEWSMSSFIQAHRRQHQWIPLYLGLQVSAMRDSASRPAKTSSMNSSIQAHRRHHFTNSSIRIHRNRHEFFHPGSQVSSRNSSIQAPQRTSSVTWAPSQTRLVFKLKLFFPCLKRAQTSDVRWMVTVKGRLH